MQAILTIDLEAIIDNWRALDGMTTCETAAVLKADAYGLGADRVGPALAAAGARTFFVALAEEGAFNSGGAFPDLRLALVYSEIDPRVPSGNLDDTLEVLPETACVHDTNDAAHVFTNSAGALAGDIVEYMLTGAGGSSCNPGGGTTGGPATSGDDTGGETETDGATPQVAGDEGCGCRTNRDGRSWSWLALVLMGAGRARRRRRAPTR